MRSSDLLFGVVAAVLITLASTTPLKFAQSSIPVGNPERVYRLPTAIKPIHYEIIWEPYFLNNENRLVGRVNINVNVTAVTNVIIVHNDNLRINESATTVTFVPNNTIVPIANQFYDDLRHFYITTFTGNLPLGQYHITYSFNGELATDMYGLYRSSYRVGNETRWMVTTQFQPTSARRAFPCFDEPGFKATFSVNVAHFPNQVALSNMPSISTSPPDNTIGGRVRTQFATTPEMSTYLLALVVSEFRSVSSDDHFFGIWSRNDAIGNTAWALETTEVLYPLFLDAVQTEDPWPKIDQVAVPDFSAGAMENWGLITYREALLLWQQGESNTRRREMIASIISHELAHIWFGNLVSPVWWDHLWFNEGFATLYEYMIPALAYPEWRFAERFVTEHQLPALLTDSLETTRPMTNVVGSPATVLASFDTIAYSKSGSVLHMARSLMTPLNFTTALSNFLSESAHGTFDPTALWSHMQAVVDVTSPIQNHMPIAAIMDSWVTQPGYPLVTVSRNYSTTVVVFSQERFFMNPDSPTANPESQRWWIPITFATGVNPTRCNEWVQPDWLRAQDKAIMIAGIGNESWIITHCQGVGFYRTNYDVRNWEMITEFLNGSNFTQINPINRAILIDDSLNLARAGYIDYTIPLNLISYLSQETDFVVWRSTIRPLNYLNTILPSEEFFPAWQAYQRSLISDLYESLGWVPTAADTHENRLHRQQILTLACEIDNADARTRAEALFNLWINNPQLNPVDPDLRSLVYCWGAKNASEQTWDIMWNRFLATDLASEEDLLLRAMACSRNSTILEKYLNLSITHDSGIRAQDTFTVFLAILSATPENVDLLMNFVYKNSGAITEFYGHFNVVASMLSGIAGRITNQDQREKFLSVANSEELGAAADVIQRGIQTADSNLVWISKYSPVIKGWLRDQGIISETVSDDNGAAVFPSSLFFIFTSVLMCMSSY